METIELVAGRCLLRFVEGDCVCQLREEDPTVTLSYTNQLVSCPICNSSVGDATYPDRVCDDCDQRAVDDDGDDPWHGWPPGEKPDTEKIRLAPDQGSNPVFIDGQKCWRRYRFGGWVTMKDEHDCDTLEEFDKAHGTM